MWGNDIYRIDCDNLLASEALKIIYLRALIIGNKLWDNCFKINCENFTRECKFYAYVPVDMCYFEHNLLKPNYYLIHHFGKNFEKLIEFYKNSYTYLNNMTDFVRNNMLQDIIENYKKYQEEALIKSIIE